MQILPGRPEGYPEFLPASAFILCITTAICWLPASGFPLIVNGRTRSQIYQNACEMKGLEPFELSRSLKAFEYQMFGRLLDKLDGRSCVDFLPEAEVTSLSYFTYHKVTDEEKMAYLEKEIGWERPKKRQAPRGLLGP